MSAGEAAALPSVNDSEGEVNSLATSAATTMTGLQQLRRIRRTRTQYEKLQRPPDIAPGNPIPSIEGWVVFLTNLPPATTAEDVQDLFMSFAPNDPSHFGSIREVKIPLDRDCRCAGHVLVELDSQQGFERACAELPGCRIPFYEDDDAEPRLLGVAPAFLAEEDEVAVEPQEAATGEKREGESPTREDEEEVKQARLE